MAQQQRPEESLERMLEQGAGQDPQNNPLLKQAQAAGGTSGMVKNPLDAALSMGDPNTWVRELYGIRGPIQTDGKQEQQQNKDKNNTPLDMNKVGSKDKPITPQQKQFFKKYQDEYVQYLEQKKKQAQDKQKQEEDEERKKKEEEKKRREEEQKTEGGQGKQKQKLGQPRRKATTEQHPETKAGGAK